MRHSEEIYRFHPHSNKEKVYLLPVIPKKVLRNQNKIFFCLHVGLLPSDWNLMLLCAAEQFSGLDAMLTNLVACINRARQQATQGKQPLLW